MTTKHVVTMLFGVGTPYHGPILDDPAGFVYARRDPMDEVAARQLRAKGWLPLTRGRWSLILPGECVPAVKAAREVYGDEAADELARIASVTDEGPILAWALIECVRRGFDGAAVPVMPIIRHYMKGSE